MVLLLGMLQSESSSSCPNNGTAWYFIIPVGNIIVACLLAYHIHYTSYRSSCLHPCFFLSIHCSVVTTLLYIRTYVHLVLLFKHVSCFVPFTDRLSKRPKASSDYRTLNEISSAVGWCVACMNYFFRLFGQFTTLVLEVWGSTCTLYTWVLRYIFCINMRVHS